MKARNSNIEMLRILCIFMVIMQHICETSMIGGFNLAQANHSLSSYWLLSFLYSLSRPAVNIFILITGYYSCKNCNRPIGKAIDLFFIVIGYSFLQFMAKVILNVDALTVRGLLYALIPQNYYVSLFVVLYFISPYINKMIKAIDKKYFTLLIFLLFILFSVWSTIANLVEPLSGIKMVGIYSVFIDGTGRGFSIVNFVMLYLIGAYIRINNIEKQKSSSMILAYILLGGFTALVRIKSPTLAPAFQNYDSFVVILQTVILFSIFINNRPWFNCKVNAIAKRVFGVFIVHFMVLKFIFMYCGGTLLLGVNLYKTIVGVAMLLFLTFIFSALIDGAANAILKPISIRWKKTSIYSFDPYDGLNGGKNNE